MQTPPPKAPPPLPQGGQHADRFRLAERARPSQVRFAREVADLSISTTPARAPPPLPSVERRGHHRLTHPDGRQAAGTAALDEAWTRKAQKEVSAQLLFVQAASHRAMRLVELAMKKMAVRRALVATCRQTGVLTDPLPEGEDPFDFLEGALLDVVTIGGAHASAFAVLDAYETRQLVADPLHQFGGHPTAAKRLLAKHRFEGFLRVDGALRRLHSAVSRMEAAADSGALALALPLKCAPWDARLREYDREVRHAFYEATMAAVRLDGVQQEAEAALSYARILLRMD